VHASYQCTQAEVTVIHHPYNPQRSIHECQGQQDVSIQSNSEPESAAHLKSKGGLGRIWKATGYALRGLAAAWRHEHAFRQELILILLLLPFAVFLQVPVLERLLLVCLLALILIVELINSSIEAIVDKASPEMHELAGRSKDIAGAAVFVTICLNAVACLVIAGPVLTAFLNR
jgi:diacylglycerol kinase (ATP)